MRNRRLIDGESRCDEGWIIHACLPPCVPAKGIQSSARRPPLPPAQPPYRRYSFTTALNDNKSIAAHSTCESHDREVYKKEVI